MCLVGKDSDPNKLKAAWTRAMRGHYDQQITVTENITDTVIGSYPLVTDTTLDNIPEGILKLKQRKTRQSAAPEMKKFSKQTLLLMGKKSTED